MNKNKTLVEHVVNIILIIIASVAALQLLLLYKAQKIADFVVPVMNGKASYEDVDIQTWLNRFDTLLYLMVGIVLLLIIVRYIIESVVITHERTLLRSMVFILAALVLEMAAVIEFFKIRAPILDGDTRIILILLLSMLALFYILMVAFVPSCIKYLLFPRNLLIRKK